MIDRKLNARLLSAASLVRQGAVFADIGTDHAYLPIFLLKGGRISFAYATDINEGPLHSAHENIKGAGLLDSSELLLTDGAAALSHSGATDYAICGMGGELIEEIIQHAPHLFSPEIRLILQPMSKQASLRSYLCRGGFEIEREVYSYDSGKYYVCLLARFTGDCREISDIEAELGIGSSEIVSMSEGAPIDPRRGYLLGRLASLTRAANGKQQSGNPSPAELAVIAEIEKILGK